MSTIKNILPADEQLVKFSRKLNWFFHGKPYMLCTFVWITCNKHEVGGSFWLTYATLMVYVPTRYLIDGFFRLKRGQKQHCRECFDYELENNAVSIEDAEGMKCKI